MLLEKTLDCPFPFPDVPHFLLSSCHGLILSFQLWLTLCSVWLSLTQISVCKHRNILSSFICNWNYFLGCCISYLLLCNKLSRAAKQLMLIISRSFGGSGTRRAWASGSASECCMILGLTSLTLSQDWKIHSPVHSQGHWQASVSCHIGLSRGLFSHHSSWLLLEWEIREIARGLFYNLVSEIMYRYLYIILLVTETNSDTMWKRTTQKHKYHEVNHGEATHIFV